MGLVIARILFGLWMAILEVPRHSKERTRIVFAQKLTLFGNLKAKLLMMNFGGQILHFRGNVRISDALAM